MSKNFEGKTQTRTHTKTAIEDSILLNLEKSAQLILAHLALNDGDFDVAGRYLTAKKFEDTPYSHLANAFWQSATEKGFLDISTAALLWRRHSKSDDSAGDFSSLSAITEWAVGIRVESFDFETQLEFYERHFKHLVEHRISAQTDVLYLQGRSPEEILEAANLFREKSGAYTDSVKEYDHQGVYELRLEGFMAGLKPSGVEPYFQSLRKYIPIFEPGELVIIAARPGQGKTKLMLDLCDGWSEEGYNGGLVSLEMGQNPLRDRILSKRVNWSVRGPRLGNQMEKEKDQVRSKFPEMRAMKHAIIDDCLTLNQIERRARQLKREKNIDYLFVDYLQIVDAVSDHIGYMNREQEISTISRRLKRLAVMLKIVVIAGSQLNRDVEKRANKRPSLSDLRESGAIEQDADIVIFIHRPETFGIEQDESGKSMRGVAYLIVAKNRNDQTGEIEIRFDGIRGFYEETSLDYFQESDAPNDLIRVESAYGTSAQMPSNPTTLSDSEVDAVFGARPSETDAF